MLTPGPANNMQQRDLNVNGSKRPRTFFIDVLTWHGLTFLGYTFNVQVNQRFWKSFFLLYICFQVEGFNGSSNSSGHHYRESNSWDSKQEKHLLGLVCLLIVCPFPYTTCLVLFMESLGPRYGMVFSPLRAPLCAFCTFECGLLFGFSILFSSSHVPLPGVFSFIYLKCIIIPKN